MSTPLEQKLFAAWPPDRWQDVTLVAAVSGGADSVALLRLLCQRREGTKGRIVVGHVHHGLRPESLEDQQFVERLCETLGVACHAHQATRIADAQGGIGWEAAARRIRYGFLEQLAGEVGARYVVTAHTQDDQVETVLHRILRGTGIRGLSGIPRFRTLRTGLALARPMLDVSRQEVETYLASLGQDYCRDATNDQSCFTRNRIRNQLLPLLRHDYNRQVDAGLLRLAQLASEVQTLVDAEVESLSEEAVEAVSKSRIVIAARTLPDQPAYLLRELLQAVWRRAGWPLRAMSYDHWQKLALFLRTADGEPPGALDLPGRVRAVKEPHRLVLTRR